MPTHGQHPLAGPALPAGLPEQAPHLRAIAMPADTDPAVDRMMFQPVLVGDEASFHATVERVGRTSVAIGEDRRPREIPPDA